MINLIKMSTDKMSMWEAQWAKGDTSFHLPEVNDRLLSYMNELVGVVTNGTTDPAAKNILVPLCGKSKDLVHLHSLGHTVVGCEGVEQVHLTLLKESITLLLLFLYFCTWSNSRLRESRRLFSHSNVISLYCRHAQSSSVKTTLNTRGVQSRGWMVPFSQ